MRDPGAGAIAIAATALAAAYPAVAEAADLSAPARHVREADDKAIREDKASASIPVPLEAQGAAFDREGKLWISSSTIRYGALRNIDSASGAVLASYDMPAGLEDLGFDADGRLWAVSEAGAMKYQK